jgi:hypothetical protein
MVELVHQLAQALLRALVLADVAGQALETDIATAHIELRLRRLLEPHLAPLGSKEAE